MLAIKLGFIGAGQMATALARGLVNARLLSAHQVLASDPVAQARGAFTQATGASCVADNARVVADCDVIVLAIKPQHVHAVLGDLRGRFHAEQLLISIVAGVSLATIASAVEAKGADAVHGPRLARVMPNTPCLIGQGASAFCLGPTARPSDAELIGSLLGAVGSVLALDEKLLNAVTGLSGSGPAFVYVMIEALSDGGVRMGLPREAALKLAAQTVAGAAAMVLSTGEHPSVLKDRVASPGGTTIAGLAELESHGLRAALIEAVTSATRRSAELAREGN